MYQRPDFVKVNLEIKDNYASYSSCIERTWTSDISGHCDVPGDPTYNFTRFTVEFASNPWECYNDKI